MFRRPQFTHQPAAFSASDRFGLLDERRLHGCCDADRSIFPAFVERISAEQARRYVVAWADLTTRALESNIFLDPAFALPAARHLSDRKGPEFLLAWEQDGTSPRKRLIAVWPIVRPRLWFGSTCKTWVHDYCCSGAPLLDKAQALRSLDAILAYLRASQNSVSILAISQIREHGATAALLRHFSALRGLALNIVAHYDRAALEAARPGVSAADFVSRKKKKELDRQLRRLRDMGPLTLGVTREGADMARHIESFLALEKSGWKGRDGGAFLNRPDHAAFVRSIAAALGAEGKCRVYWMASEDKIIASNVVFFTGETAYFWKTAYDEDFAFSSPGVLLTMSMTDSLLHEPGVRSVDSCAVSGHPMIDHIWRDRTPMADVMLSLRADRPQELEGAVKRELFRRRMREKAKSAWAHLGFA
ncbi:GNAT family N-acetyltransferase [Rhodoblastus sp. 17X3]|uniref:GNAT family N-acetyltransferase n=1 Tax=Rhodoblastus sp. 17X3 TaxID=3047026 RepID=UPI0024B83BF8|nr:GNAT family N-acetyltransferase [Rhodoblastus sp. 17X3]MDI9848303.1 GNAT family N-acetyltransferase [Rhodoblastus sp. 17X3]